MVDMELMEVSSDSKDVSDGTMIVRFIKWNRSYLLYECVFVIGLLLGVIL